MLQGNAFAQSGSSWSGAYAGASGGYGSGHSTQNDTAVPPASEEGDGSYAVKGGMLGGGGGYNMQFGTWLAGIEGDYAWSAIRGSSSTCGGNSTCGADLKSIGTLRGRAGWITGETLLFATFGAAIGDIYAYDLLEATGRGRKTKAGWTAGGGIERRINAQWSVKREYLYLDFGTAEYFTLSNRTPEQVGLQTSLVRAGFNFRF